jgi:hypothetical protein
MIAADNIIITNENKIVTSENREKSYEQVRFIQSYNIE